MIWMVIRVGGRFAHMHRGGKTLKIVQVVTDGALNMTVEALLSVTHLWSVSASRNCAAKRDWNPGLTRTLFAEFRPCLEGAVD